MSSSTPYTRVERLLGHLSCNPLAGSSATSTASSAGPAVPSTADLCDDHTTSVTFIPLPFRWFGRSRALHAPVETLRVFEDNGVVRSSLESPGNGRILLVDGGGSNRCALVGDQLAALAVKNNWAGVVVNGYIRDSSVINEMDNVAVLALGTCPVKSIKRNTGEKGIPVQMGTVGPIIQPGDYLYADADGVLISKKKLY